VTRWVRNPVTGEMEVSRQPENVVVRVEAPRLAIVDRDFASAVDDRLAAMSGEVSPAR
jgi:hypothetical protein